MAEKTHEQGVTIDSIRDLYRRMNDFASVTHTFGAANTQMSVRHTLGRPPRGWEVRQINAAGHVYSTANPIGTASVIYLKCSAQSAAVTLRIK